jgi:hypothetical protein
VERLNREIDHTSLVEQPMLWRAGAVARLPTVCNSIGTAGQTTYCLANSTDSARWLVLRLILVPKP